uniref:Large ribosomal subunit protein uL16m n=1 Tax=Jaagichlorella hainangensis TaxID=445995 RepID=A0A6M8U8Z9_9CHLO|nr:50S ribosomal protein L16 [Jaagichlorella hainangensis]QKJ84927.1 50S ribosomal protein L16 [Jaagichlorella hainangensis]
MFIPRKTKFKKLQTKAISGIQSNLKKHTGGRFGIIAQTNAMLNAKTIEAVRRIFTKKFKRSGKVRVNMHCNQSITKKPLESRMGKGKGSFSHWVCRIRKGQVLYSLDGINNYLAKEAFLLASSKLGIKTKLSRTP